jgi:hypothetical protein
VIVLRRLTRAIGPLRLLAVFAFVFRRGPGETPGRAPTADCEKVQPDQLAALYHYMPEVR